MTGDRAPSVFVVARNPQDDSKLPYLLRLPLEDGSNAAAPAVEPRPKSGFTTPTPDSGEQCAKCSTIRYVRGSITSTVFGRLPGSNSSTAALAVPAGCAPVLVSGV